MGIANNLRMLRLAWEAYRVPRERRLVRVGVVHLSSSSPEKRVKALLTGTIAACAHAYVSSGSADTLERAPARNSLRHGIIIRWATRHVDRHIDGHSGAVPVPGWASLSRENRELDCFFLGKEGAGRSRMNALLIMHDVAASHETSAVLNEFLSGLSGDVPVVLCGDVPVTDVELGEFGLSQPNYARCGALQRELAEQHPAVYAVNFASPGLWAQGFHPLYAAQSAVLYPKSRLCGEHLDTACIAIAAALGAEGATCADAWDTRAVEALGSIVYGRPLDDSEQDELMRSLHCGVGNGAEVLKSWLEGLAMVGKADAAFAILRAFGFDGALRRRKPND